MGANLSDPEDDDVNDIKDNLKEMKQQFPLDDSKKTTQELTKSRKTNLEHAQLFNDTIKKALMDKITKSDLPRPSDSGKEETYRFLGNLWDQTAPTLPGVRSQTWQHRGTNLSPGQNLETSREMGPRSRGVPQKTPQYGFGSPMLGMGNSVPANHYPTLLPTSHMDEKGLSIRSADYHPMEDPPRVSGLVLPLPGRTLEVARDNFRWDLQHSAARQQRAPPREEFLPHLNQDLRDPLPPPVHKSPPPDTNSRLDPFAMADPTALFVPNVRRS